MKAGGGRQREAGREMVERKREECCGKGTRRLRSHPANAVPSLAEALPLLLTNTVSFPGPLANAASVPHPCGLPPPPCLLLHALIPSPVPQEMQLNPAQPPPAHWHSVGAPSGVTQANNAISPAGPPWTGGDSPRDAGSTLPSPVSVTGRARV